MPIKYIGRTTDFKGKTLWEIVGNLKNFGVGRIVVRSRFERYPEPSYLKICKVETLPNEDPRKVRVWAEKVFRGRKYTNLVEVCSASYKADYRLLHKDEEEAYCRFEPSTDKEERILPEAIQFPPLLKEVIMRDLRAKGQSVVEEPLLKVKYKQGRQNIARKAADGEKPTVVIQPGLGKPASPELFEGII
ncbi:small ribosomal subunit protein mS34 [Anabrus simplex]|uniref:small ribosomal subunit protein mS34 n=1 Tax=Anabrus simplex TaxID=316456 RepID=UPI0035A37035